MKTSVAPNDAVVFTKKGDKQGTTDDGVRQPSLNNLPSNEDLVTTSDDLIASDLKMLTVHNSIFTKLLQLYVVNLQRVLKDKRDKKDKVYRLSFSILIAFSLFMMTVVAVSMMLLWYKNIDATKLLVAILPSMISFVTVVIEIPKLISKYLFNEKEEEIMSNVIKAIQEYDLKVRADDYMHKLNTQEE